ncbi:hypothetical protein MRX96_055894 [Rhipicephalus microplus]
MKATPRNPFPLSGGTVSKSTRVSHNEKPPASITGTPSSMPRTVSSTTMTYTPAKSPDSSKHSPEASKKSGEHRSSLKTSPSKARTPAELLRSKSKTPPLHRSHYDTQLSLAIKNTRIECEGTCFYEIAVERTDIHSQDKSSVHEATDSGKPYSSAVAKNADLHIKDV